MTYVEGFVAAVPRANKELYLEHAYEASKLFCEWGALRVVENWGDDIPRGEVNDFFTAVHAKDDEVVVFSWIEYPDRETRDRVVKRMMDDPAMESVPQMPFDGKRMIFGGFTNLFVVE